MLAGALASSPITGDVISRATEEGVVSVTSASERDSLPAADPAESGVVGAAVIKPGRLRLLKNDKRAARFTSLGVMLLMLMRPL